LKQPWLASLFAIAIASAAEGVSLSVSPDKLIYFPGETITLSVYGDAEGTSAFGIYGRLVYDGSIVNNGTRSQKRIGDGWVKGALVGVDNGGPGSYSEAFNQLHASGGFQTATNPIATITLIATFRGIVNIDWDTTGIGTQLTYFGLTSAPGTTFCIENLDPDGTCRNFVPEPGTFGLLSMGLLALARRRST
jgi:hypothetical protein